MKAALSLAAILNNLFALSMVTAFGQASSSLQFDKCRTSILHRPAATTSSNVFFDLASPVSLGK
ncbi:MAG: hypothetical protein GY701_10425 [Sulfitobacter sp.]|nr:hypothetical protein [Sulfitobacter sp.]